MTTTDQVGLWDADFPCLRLRGKGTREFLHGQTTADIKQSSDGRLIRSCWLTATGRVQALLEVRLENEGADVLVLHGDAEAVAAGFDRVIFPADHVQLAPLTQQRRIQRLTPAHQVLDWDNDVIWADAIPAEWTGIARLDDAAFEHWRISQGLPFSSNELNGDTNPLELGLSDWISLEKGCYLGQETLAKVATRDGVKQHLRCWQLSAESSAAPHTCPTPGQRLLHEGDRAGVITSVLHGNGQHSVQPTIGLALVRRQAVENKVLQLEDGRELALHNPPCFSTVTDGDSGQ